MVWPGVGVQWRSRTGPVLEELPTFSRRFQVYKTTRSLNLETTAAAGACEYDDRVIGFLRSWRMGQDYTNYEL